MTRLDDVQRDTIALVCTCGVPAPFQVGALGFNECATCGRLIVGAVGRELIERHLQLIDVYQDR